MTSNSGRSGQGGAQPVLLLCSGFEVQGISMTSGLPTQGCPNPSQDGGVLHVTCAYLPVNVTSPLDYIHLEKWRSLLCNEHLGLGFQSVSYFQGHCESLNPHHCRSLVENKNKKMSAHGDISVPHRREMAWKSRRRTTAAADIHEPPGPL